MQRWGLRHAGLCRAGGSAAVRSLTRARTVLQRHMDVMYPLHPTEAETPGGPACLLQFRFAFKAEDEKSSINVTFARRTSTMPQPPKVWGTDCALARRQAAQCTGASCSMPHLSTRLHT